MKSWWCLVLGLVLSLGAGCSRSGPAAQGPEVEDPGYIAAQRLVRAGEPQRALIEFKKVIARRPDDAPESHLDAGNIQLNTMKQPIAAIHHFNEYLRLKQYSAVRANVEGLIQAATREILRTLPGANVTSVELVQLREENVQLRQQNDELRAQISAMVVTGTRNAIVPATPTVPALGPPSAAIPSVNTGTPPSGAGGLTLAGFPATTNAGLGTPPASQRSTAVATATKAPPGRTHTIAQGETISVVSRRYYGDASTASLQKIEEANRDVLPQGIDSVKPGMVLKIP